MTKEQITKLFELRQQAQDMFYKLENGKPFSQLSITDQNYAMYYKGREEALSNVLYILDLN